MRVSFPTYAKEFLFSHVQLNTVSPSGYAIQVDHTYDIHMAFHLNMFCVFNLHHMPTSLEPETSGGGELVIPFFAPRTKYKRFVFI